MPDLITIPSNSAFNAKILTTFGKLNDQDILDVDGCAERLITQLMDRYGWGPAYAQTNVNRFCTKLSESITSTDHGANQ